MRMFTLTRPMANQKIWTVEAGTFIPNLTQFLGMKKLRVEPTVAVLRSQGQVCEGLL